MDDFNYRAGQLYCEDVPAAAIAEAAGTPTFVYSRATLEGHYDRLAAAFAPLDPLICFSIKSCSNLSICRILAARGAGMDLVSGGELHRALAAGVDPADCVYAGVGKTDAEIRASIEAGVGWFNVESEAEFTAISAIAADIGRPARAALRVNPDVDPKTHRYTTTGKRETKFGVDIERARAFFAEHGADEHCRATGIHLHLGSPIYTTDPYVRSIEKVLVLIDELATIGVRIDSLNLGGGFGADYESDQSPVAADYARDIVPLLEQRAKNGLKILLEPGRSIAANAGILLLRVIFTKTSGDKKFIICDGGMNVLLRPSHYEAFHFMWPAAVHESLVPPRRAQVLDLPGLERVDVVGPICETGDFIAIDRDIPPMHRGDLLAVFTTGAYGMTMASRYNSMPLPAEVLVSGDTVEIIRQRETWDDLTRHEASPVPLPLGGVVTGGAVVIRREDDGIWIEFEEQIPVHHEDVFECLCTGGGLSRWFPVSAEIEARTGGKLTLGWDESMERRTTVAVLEFDPGGRITWDWYAGPEDRHAPVYWSVEPDVEKGSIVKLRQGPFFDDTDSLIDMAREAASWQRRLCNLRSTLEAKLDMRKVKPL